MANFTLNPADYNFSTNVVDSAGSPFEAYTTTAFPNATTPSSLLKTIEKEFKNLPTAFFIVLLVTCVLVIIWAIYIALYNSRVIGILVTALINKLTKGADIRIGSLSISVLGGKLMFRDIHYVTYDYSIRIQYGFAIFRWWHPYTPKETPEEVQVEPTRLSFYMEGVQFHVYNRSSEYARLERLFNMEELMIPSLQENLLHEDDERRQLEAQTQPSNEGSWLNWRNLIPLIKFDVTDARVIFGNNLLPSSLMLRFDDAKCSYSTRKASHPADPFMHMFKCSSENLRVMLVPSQGYKGPKDQPPRYMGDGYVILQSNNVDFYYYQDEPGAVPLEPEVLQMASGECVIQQTHPEWGLEVRCGKTSNKTPDITNLSYGPWTDRQRAYLHKFFFPSDHQTMDITQLPTHNQLRKHDRFDFKMMVLGDIMVDILFTKHKETQALHIHGGPGSSVEWTLPMVVQNDGYKSLITGQILHCDMTTSLEARSFIKAETLKYEVEISYPRVWNDDQDWKINITSHKTSVWFLFEHVNFFYDLIVDWSSPHEVPDIYSFVPYTWHMNFLFKEFELLLGINEFNWMDTASDPEQIPENCQFAICGEILDCGVKLPFIDYLSPTTVYDIFVRGEELEARLYVPETYTSQALLLSLAENAKVTNRAGVISAEPFGSNKLWRHVTRRDLGWIDVMTTPILAIKVKYEYYPMYVLTEQAYIDMIDSLVNQADNQPCPNSYQSGRMKAGGMEDNEEAPLKIVTSETTIDSLSEELSKSLDPATLDPHRVTVEVEVGSSEIMLYGSILKFFMQLKENYFGYYQKFVPMLRANEKTTSLVRNSETLRSTSIDPKANKLRTDNDDGEKFDPRQFRPLAVKVAITLHDIHGHLVKHCTELDPACPSLYIDRLGFEMDKDYQETKLQVVLSPAILLTKDNIKRPKPQQHLSEGHLTLSGLQMRGHAMFSHKDLPLESETLEYAWLIELTVGDLKGKLTISQLHPIIQFLQTAVFLIDDVENQFCRPEPEKCQHKNLQHQCSLSTTALSIPNKEIVCPTEEDVKYRMTRVSVDLVDLYLVESGAALNITLTPIRLSTCNLHGESNKTGITALVDRIHMKQYLYTASNLEVDFVGEPWLEAGSVSLGPINVDAATSLAQLELHPLQHLFLKRHDKKTGRLWFLWNGQEQTQSQPNARCGCNGGCAFFGKNSRGGSFFDTVSLFDLQPGESSMMVMPSVTTQPDEDAGYGQSILREHSLVFDLPNPLNRKPRVDYDSDIETPLISDPVVPFPREDKSQSPTSFSPMLRRRLVSQQNKEDSDSDSKSNKSVKFLNPSDQMRHSFKSRKTNQSIDRRSLLGAAAKSVDTGSIASTISSGADSFYSVKSSMEDFSSLSSRGNKIATSRQQSLVSSNSLYELSSPYPVDNSIKKSSSTNDIDTTLVPGAENSNQNAATINEFEDDEIDSSGSDDTVYNLPKQTPTRATVIDLHAQLKEPILRSPLLMDGYMKHMTQMRCSYWTNIPDKPYPHLPRVKSPLTPMVELANTLNSEHARYVYPPNDISKWAPQFYRRRQGFHPGLFTNRPNLLVSENSEDKAESNLTADTANSQLGFVEGAMNTTAICKLKGSLDAIISPLALEAVQRYIEALTPILSNLHPSTLVDDIHSKVSSDVQAQNKIKKQQSKQETSAIPEQVQNEAAAAYHKIGLKINSEKLAQQDTRDWRLQVMFQMSRVNLCILQASVSEDLPVATAILSDKPKDLTCVSVLAVCFDKVSATLLMHNKSKISLDVQPAAGTKKGMFPPTRGLTIDAEDDEPTEQNTEELVGNLSIARMHIQFRRLQDGSIPKNTKITAIPENKSRVLFTLPPERSKDSEEQRSSFIMFEFGFEKISFNTARRIGFSEERRDETLINQPSFHPSAPGSSAKNTEELKGDATSAVIDIKLIWFRFAAPSPSKSAQLEFTRMDWNLLSTASPAIDAWLNPSNRLAVSVSNLMSGYKRRITSVIACIMTDALDTPGMHFIFKNRFNVNTSLSKALQEDPSCQLATVLRRYIHKSGVFNIELALASPDIPELVTLQKGILALTRQWKNQLYMPTLVETRARKRRGAFTVHFDVPREPQDIAGEDAADLDNDSVNMAADLPPEAEDEIIRSRKNSRKSSVRLSRTTSLDTVSKYATPERRHSTTRDQRPPLSAVFKHGSQSSLPSTAARNLGHVSTSGSQIDGNFTEYLRSLDAEKDKEDNLYRWMARQQERKDSDILPAPVLRHGSFINDFNSDVVENGTLQKNEKLRLLRRKDEASVQLADAQIMFKPLLEAVGLNIHGIKSSTLMKKVGGNLSMNLVLHSLRIDIIDDVKRDLKSGRTTSTAKQKIELQEVPAFQCNLFTANIGLKDEFDKDLAPAPGTASTKPSKFAITVAMKNLDSKPTTTKAYVSLDVASMAQNVNMSLLRLVHQLINVVDNITKTNAELKKIKRKEKKHYRKTHRKQDSSSSADTAHTDIPGLVGAGRYTPPPSRAARAPERPASTGFSGSADFKLDDMGLALATLPKVKLPKEQLPPGVDIEMKPLGGTSVSLHSSSSTHGSSEGRSSPGNAEENKAKRPNRLEVGVRKFSLALKQPGSLKSPASPSPKYLASPSHSQPDSMNSASLLPTTSKTPECWKNLSHLLELYSNMPDTKTVNPKGSRLSDIVEEVKADPVSAAEEGRLPNSASITPQISRMQTEDEEVDVRSSYKESEGQRFRDFIRGAFTGQLYSGESILLVVFGFVRIHKSELTASLSGLQLKARVTELGGSISYKEKETMASKKRLLVESSVNLSMRDSAIDLLEDSLPVVSVCISTSHALYSGLEKLKKQYNTGVLTVGAIDIHIPQNPGTLHSMVTRNTKNIQSTLQEFKKPTQSRTSMATAAADSSASMSHTASEVYHPAQLQQQQSVSQPDFADLAATNEPKKPTLPAFVIHFRGILQGLVIRAVLLPSLEAQYKIGKVVAYGVTGSKAKFSVSLPHHSLSFNSKSKDIEVNMPNSASIELPAMHMDAEYRPHNARDSIEVLSDHRLILREGHFLDCVATVGQFEHTLSTDLLNHLVLVQKVFVKEVNEVLLKVGGGEKSTPLWTSGPETPKDPILYKLYFKLKGIQITATTPTANAVRFETGEIEMELSNRVQNITSASKKSQSQKDLRIFGKAHVEINVSLGQLISNPLFIEAGTEFQVLSFFNTKIDVRNALQDEMLSSDDKSGNSKDKEALLISLQRPIVFIHPVSFDKAVMVWLNYRNAYEYWHEQRMALNSEIQEATQSILEHTNLVRTMSSMPQTGSTIFLQLTVDDIGVCVPLSPSLAEVGQQRSLDYSEGHSALVLTIEKTQIHACSRESLVTNGTFTGFCLRFAEEFEVTLDDWKPDKRENPVMNACVVNQGTYKVCSMTIPKPSDEENAKWILNIAWEMEGFVMNLNTQVSGHLADLGHTLTILTSEEEDDGAAYYDSDASSSDDEVLIDQEHTHATRTMDMPEFVYDYEMDQRRRVRLIDLEMSKQAKIIEDLRSLDAKPASIETEEKKLQELEAVLFRDFRRDFVEKIRKQSFKAKSLRDKLGLGLSRSHSSRTQSFSSSNPATSSVTSTSGNKRKSMPVSADTDVSSRTLGTIESDSLDSLADEIELEYLRSSADQAEDDSRRSSPSKQDPRANATQAPSEPIIDLVMDLKVTIQSGQLILHPDATNNPDDSNAKDRSKALQSALPSSSRLASLVHNDSSSLLRSISTSPQSTRKFKSDMLGARSKGQDNRTVFLLPGIEVKVQYSSKTGSNETPTSSLERDVEPPSSVPRKSSAPPDLKIHRSQTTPDRLLYQSNINRSGSPNRNSPGPKIIIKSDEEPIGRELADDSSLPHTSKPANLDGSKLPVWSGSRSSLGSAGSSSKKKRACLYTWIEIQALPEEMIVTTNLLDFLEQSLEKVDISKLINPSRPKPEAADPSLQQQDFDTSSASAINNQSSSNFPVDLIVYCSVHPSTIRFSCQPVSKVECLLQLPSVDIVFSTQRFNLDAAVTDTRPSSPTQGKSKVFRASTPTKQRTSSGSRPRGASIAHEPTIPAYSHTAGLSVYFSLSNFSFFVFHPYGGGGMAGKKSTNLQSAIKEETKARKDSLSLNVDSVKIHLARSRKTLEMPAAGKRGEKFSNNIRVSTLWDIGFADFKFDMRRLQEILALPKAWYRRSLARRLLLGDESALQPNDTQATATDTVSGSVTPQNKRKLDRMHTAPTPLRRSTSLLKSPATPQHAGQLSTQPLHSSDDKADKPGSKGSWQTRVLIGLNLNRCEIKVNMGNLMGSSLWKTNGVQCQGRFSINSTGHKNMQTSLKIDHSAVESRGGVVGGQVNLYQLCNYLTLNEGPQSKPEHKLKAGLNYFDIKLDYMGASICMIQLSKADINLNDEWIIARSGQGSNASSTPTDTPLATNRPAQVFINGQIKWDQWYMMITKSTTPDLIKMAARCDEYYRQQMKSSRRVFGAPDTKQDLGPSPSASATDLAQAEESAGQEDFCINHRRHWQSSLIKSQLLDFLSVPHGTLLGGNMTFEGGNLSLVCYHGINLRSKSWVVFIMNEPRVSFSTEAQHILNEDNSKETSVIQDFSFHLGHANTRHLAHTARMATICKVTRSQIPPAFSTVSESFGYAFANSDLKAFMKSDSAPEPPVSPTATSPTQTEPPDVKAAGNAASAAPIPLKSKSSSGKRLSRYNHDLEVIFDLPGLQLQLRTEHRQTQNTPREDEARPVVTVTFVTEFDGHIAVAMDAELILWLHDVVTSYVREKDSQKGSMKKNKKDNDGRVVQASTKFNTDPTSELKKDWRQFECKTWQLEPSVRLLSWTGRGIEPVGVDYVLQKLGFSHARTTIPKWIQRGIMDPCDLMCASFVESLIERMIEKKKETARLSITNG